MKTAAKQFPFGLALGIVILLESMAYFPPEGLGSRVYSEADYRMLPSLYSEPSGAFLQNSRTLLLFVVDLEDFLCFLCRESFLQLYQSLPLPIQEDMSWGVIIFDEKERARRTRGDFQIIGKKLQAFLRANRIKTPFFIDRSGILEKLGTEGSAVFLFDQGKGSLKKILFPLNPQQKQELLNALSVSKGTQS